MTTIYSSASSTYIATFPPAGQMTKVGHTSTSWVWPGPLVWVALVVLLVGQDNGGLVIASPLLAPLISILSAQ